jgi:hypothetical protein
MSELDERTANAYSRALAAARAAFEVGPADAARAARDELLEVTDPAELQRIAGALAFLAVHALPRRTRRGRSVREVLDGVAAEVLWRAS